MTEKQLFYEDVEIGTKIPILTRTPSLRQLVMWASASGDFYEIHYDKDFAQSQGLPKPILHGWLNLSFLCQMLTDWVGPEGIIHRVGCNYRGSHLVDEPISCHGAVTKKYEQMGKHYVECDIHAENSEGKRNTPGSATVILPSRTENIS